VGVGAGPGPGASPSAAHFQPPGGQDEAGPAGAGGGGAGGGSPQKAKKSMSTPNLTAVKNPILDPEEIVDNAPLLFQPGKTGFYAPVPGRASAERLNAFRNAGRLIGICLLQNELLPMPLCRHVLKYILGRTVNWYDLAFYDSYLFESLRALVQDGHDPADLHLTFSLDLLPEEVRYPGRGHS
jgi:HECT-domain (ubiquitin-transferase)